MWALFSRFFGPEARGAADDAHAKPRNPPAVRPSSARSERGKEQKARRASETAEQARQGGQGRQSKAVRTGAALPALEHADDVPRVRRRSAAGLQ